MASIDALTGVFTGRKSLDAGSDHDPKLDLTSTVSETPVASAHEAQEQGEGRDDGNAEVRIQTEKPRRSARVSSIPNSAVQDSEDGEDEVLDFIEVGKPAPPPKSPRFFTDHEHTTSGDVKVEVPGVQRRWEYRVFDKEYTVRSVLRELRDSNEVKFEVRFEDGHITLLPLNQLVNLTNGTSALSAYKKSSRSRRLTRSGSEASSGMASARQAASKRSRQPGFVDSSTIDLLSEDDELASSNPAGLRKTRSKGLLSVPQATLRGRPSRRNGIPSDSSQSQRTSSEETSSRSGSHQAVKGVRRDQRRTTRSTRSATSRSRNVKGRTGLVNYDEDSSVDSTVGGSSDVETAGKRKRRRSLRASEPRKSRILSRGLKRNQSPPANHNRRSVRIGRAAMSVMERGEDDISENDQTSHAPRAVGAREVFQELSRNDAFRLRHCQTCETCNVFGRDAEKGSLVFCQGCTLSYHKACLGPRNGRSHLVTKIDEEDFVLQCRRCIGIAGEKDPMAPNQAMCQTCGEVGPACRPFRERKTSKQEQKDREANEGEDPITQITHSLRNNVDNVLFRCTQCWRAFHIPHLPPRGSNAMEIDTENDGDERFSEYCQDWTCKECADAPGIIDSLVAWRPVDEDNYTPGFSTDMMNEDDKEYLVKWKGLSYFKTTWMPGAWVWGVTAAAMRKAFERRNNGNNLPKMRAEDVIPEDYLRVDIVLDVEYTNIVQVHTEDIDLARIKEVRRALVKFKGLGYEDVVWEDAPVPEDGERWTDFASAYNDWVRGKYIQVPIQHNLNRHLKKVRSSNFESQLMKQTQPSTLTGGTMMGYQLEGLNWLYYQWYKCHNAILADEMGLGKTIQVIGLLATLVQDHKCFPFLIVVPNSTCANWRREIKQWAPSLRVVTYFGSATARNLAHKYELFPAGSKELKCHVVVTSYDAAQADECKRFFRSVSWAGLIVDEGQRLKNDNNLLYGALSVLKAPFKVLLTGTPLQNNARELFNLLQFLDPNIDASALEAEYETLTKENVPQLHELVRPFFLRRTKAQVLTFLPPMAQIIVPVTMSIVQKKLYKSILAKNPELIQSIFDRKRLKQAERSSLNNLLMQLRKCLCHPFVYNRAIEERSNNATISHRNLVEASSKLQLLDIMLPKLQERGHRVLIFSQFLDMLDIVEDFLDGLGLLYERLDGSISSLQKQKRIDKFNAPDSPLFAFLLSTRAGGVGINLATADTVIIMDPDFNPHQDIQALSRAHRIGQKKKVLVFQLMTRDSAEEKIMQIGKKKMALDHVLIEQMDADDEAGIDLESILLHGTEALFKDDDKGDIHYDSASVDKLLDRTQAENTKTGNDNSAESQFSFARVWLNDKGDLEEGLEDSDSDRRPPDPSMWEKLLKERERAAAHEAAARQETFGRGKRKRHAVDYSKQTDRIIEQGPGSPANKAQDSDSDTDFQARVAESEADDTAEEDPADEGAVNVAEELRSPVKRRSRGIAASQGSPEKSTEVRQFARARVISHPAPYPVPVPVPEPHANGAPNVEVNRTHGGQRKCVACDGFHAVGYCPLKAAGVEYCGLCGLAHYGHQRTCPHLNSEMQVRTMLQTLKKSTEPKPLIELAVKHLRGIVGDLTRRKKLQEAKAQAKAQGQQHRPHAQAPGHSNHFPPAQYQQPSQPRYQQLAQDRAQADALGPTSAQAYALQSYQEARVDPRSSNGMNAYDNHLPGPANGTGARDTPWEV